MNRTKIEYLTYSWNPIAMRCTPVSEGCEHCWHLDVNKRFKLHSGSPELREKELDALAKLKKPSRIGTQFMGDLFHENVEHEMQSSIFVEMFLNPQHTYLILTKRPENMLKFLENFVYMGAYWFRTPVKYHPHIWLGVTVENYDHKDRIKTLLQIPAAVHWVSHEPALGPIIYPPDFLALGNRAWVASGAESGSGARPSEIDWFRQDRLQCVIAGVPFFLKQMNINGKLVKMPELDGRTWAEYPQDATK